MVSINSYLIVSAVIFTIGIAGVLIRRNALVILMSIEIMMNAVNLSFLAYAKYLGNMEGHIFTFISISVAAAEIAIGLAILVIIFRNKQTLNTDDLNIMKW